MDTTLITVSVTILLAAAGYIATYLNGLRLARRKDRLDRVSKQLSDFYGPLLALSRATERSWSAFVDAHGSMPSAEDRKAHFRLWMREVFMPLNIRMVDVVTNKADLLDEPYVPELLLELCAHVASYRAILKRWEEGDFSETAAKIPFPGPDLNAYAERTFARLKAEQNDLLGVKGPDLDVG